MRARRLRFGGVLGDLSPREALIVILTVLVAFIALVVFPPWVVGLAGWTALVWISGRDSARRDAELDRWRDRENYTQTIHQLQADIHRHNEEHHSS